MTTVLVTGCNRGIGLELCRQYAARDATVYGACRTKSEALENIDMQVIEGVDVSSDLGVEKMRRQLKGVTVDVLINNAGILRGDTLDSVNFADMEEQYRVNTIGPLRVVRALRDNLGTGSKVGIVTSRVGSIEDNGSGNNYGYRCSKAAANMVGKNLQHDLASGGIAVALLHPGLVATDMTGGRGISAEDSARGVIARMDELSMETSGHFWHAEGYELPW